MALRVSLFLDDKATKKLKGFAGTVIGTAGKMAKFGALGVTAFAAISAKMAGDFNKGLREISTLMTNVTEKDIKVMGKELESLSGKTGLAINSLVKARYDIVSAGFSDAAKSAIVLGESAKLAVGGVTSAAQAADIMTTALNAYKLTANDAADVSDILFTTVRLGKTTMTELAASMGNMLPIAKSANVRLEDAAAALALVTANGIDTATASTSLKNAFKSLAAPTDDAQAAMEKAGIKVQYMNDGSMDLVATLKQFSGLSLAQLKEFIPDIRAINAIQIMADKIDQLGENVEQFGNRSGAANTSFEKMMKEWNTKLSRLKNNFARIMRAVGNQVISILTPFVDRGNEILGKLGDIGWDKVFGIIRAEWVKFGTILQEIFKIILEPLPRIIGNAFKLMAKVGAMAFKIGWMAAGITIKGLLFPTNAAENLGKLIGAVGADAAKKFLESGNFEDLGVEIAEKMATGTKEEMIALGETLGIGDIIAANMGNLSFVGKDSADQLMEGFRTGLETGDLASSFGEDFKKAAAELDFSSMMKGGFFEGMGISPERVADLQRKVDEMIAIIEEGARKTELTDETSQETRARTRQNAVDMILASEIVLTDEQLALLNKVSEARDENQANALQKLMLFHEQEIEMGMQAASTALSAIMGFQNAKITALQVANQKATEGVTNTAANEIKIIKDKVAQGLLTEQSGANQIKIIEANKQAEIDTLNKRALEDERAIKRKQQKFAIASALIDTAGAIMKIWNGPGGPIMKTAMTVAVAALGASNIAQISAQTFARGGVVKGFSTGGSVPVGDTVPAMLTPGEMVSTKSAVDQFGAEIADMNQRAAGGSGGGQPMVININAVDGESVYRVLIDNKSEFSKAFKEIRKTGHLN